MIAALKRLGVNVVEKQLKVANLSSEFFKEDFGGDGQIPVAAGVGGRGLEGVAGVGQPGISNVSIPERCRIRKSTNTKEQVRVEAMQNAKQSAQTLAEAIGQKIGKCFYIYDSNNNVMPVFYDNMAVMRSAKAMGVAEDAAADEPLDFKTIKLQYNVQAKFVLE